MKNVLKNKIFMATFVSDMLSNFGDVLYYLALMNYVLLLPEAKFAISLVTLSESLPFLTMIFMAMWGDKTKNKVDTIMVSQLFRVALYVIVGLAMGFQPALWIVLVAIGVNILADLAGQYENALYTPLSLRVVSMDDREAMYAFRQGTSSILQVVFQSSGAILIALMSYQQLAFFNAGTFAVSFFIMLLLRPALTKLLKDNPIQTTEEEGEDASSFLRDSWKNLKASYQAVQSIPVLKASILTIAGLNAVFSAQDSLLLLSMKEHADFILINPATTLAAITIIALAGNVLGSIFVTTIGKQMSFETLLKISVCLPVLLFFGFYFHNIYMIFAVDFAAMVTIGIFNPKMNAFVARKIPENRLATIGAGIDTFCTLGSVLSRLLLALLVIVFSAQWISLGFIIISMILCGYTWLASRKSAGSHEK